MMKPLPLYARVPTFVFWDIKTYPVPSACDATRVAPCIRRFLKNSGYSGRVHIFAVGLLTDVPCDVLRALSSTGIVLHHVSLDSVGILSAMYCWIENNRRPKNMMFVSSNPSFSEPVYANKHRDVFNIFELFPYDSCNQEYDSCNQESRWKNFLLEDSASLKEYKCSETFWVCSVCKYVYGQGFEKLTTHLNAPEHTQEATCMEEKAGAVTVFWDIKSLPVPPDCDPHRVGPWIKRVLKGIGYSGRITIAVIGRLTDVPVDVLRALSSTTGIVLVNVISGSKDFVPYMYQCLSDSSPANLIFIRPEFSEYVISDLQMSGHNVIQQFLRLCCFCWEHFLLEGSGTLEEDKCSETGEHFLLEGSGTLEEDKCSETGEPVSWVCTAYCKDICGQGFENFTMHLNSKEHVERWNRRLYRSSEKDKEAVEAGDEEISATMATTVFWDIKRFPVPPDCDPRLVGPCIKRFLKDKGYSGHITIIVIGLLTDVPVDVLCALSSTTGIVLRNVGRGSKAFFSVVYLWALDMLPSPANMMLIGFCPKGFSDVISNLPRLGFSIIHPFPYRNVESLWKNFLLEDSGTLEEDKSSETGEPVSWVCKVSYDICGQGQGFENFTMHLNSKEHVLEMLYRSNEKDDEEAVEAGDEAHLESASMMWEHVKAATSMEWEQPKAGRRKRRKAAKKRRKAAKEAAAGFKLEYCS